MQNNSSFMVSRYPSHFATSILGSNPRPSATFREGFSLELIAFAFLRRRRRNLPAALSIPFVREVKFFRRKIETKRDASNRSRSQKHRAWYTVRWQSSCREVASFPYIRIFQITKSVYNRFEIIYMYISNIFKDSQRTEDSNFEKFHKYFESQIANY